jgi:phosphatidate cytidylyltransferase
MSETKHDPTATASDSRSDDAPAPNAFSELQLRIFSAVFLAGFALFCTWMGGKTFLLLAIVASTLIFYEFRGLVRSAMPARIGWFAFGFLLMVFASYLVERPDSGILVAAMATIVLMVWEWVVRRSVWAGVLLVYAAAPFAAIVGLRQGEIGLFDILFIMGCVWGADTLAYFTGKKFGGPKLAPKISPKKTWSGFAGGIVGSILVSALIARAFGYLIGPGMVFLAIFLSLVSQVGDLFESWVKRRFGVKDSGRLIPGHGGILDRIDGLIFALVAAWLLGMNFAGEFGSATDLSLVIEGTFFKLQSQ